MACLVLPVLCQQMPMVAADLECACGSFNCSARSTCVCAASESVMLHGMEVCAVHALTFISLTCSGALDLYNPCARQEQPVV